MLVFVLSPLSAQAGFLSSILGEEVVAQQVAQVSSTSLNQNSQTMALLEVGASHSAVFQNKSIKSKEEKTGDKDVAQIDESAVANIVSDSAMLPSTGPMGVSDGTAVDPALLETSVYVVRKGDSLTQIAQMFGVSVNTILWANDMKKGDTLREGDVLFILPVSGLEHTVAKGQTLESIAKLYKVDIIDILQHNDISRDFKLSVGDKLMIPDAVKATESDKPIVNLNASIAKDKKYYETHAMKNLAGYYINPVPGYRKSQGIHDKNAVDLAIGTGTPIRAAAAGRVKLARNGYNGGYGNLVIIQHPNGTETLYAHQSKIATSTGAQVSQGQVIGYVGSTGRSTGPHLHFEVHGARNPGADASWANY